MRHEGRIKNRYRVRVNQDFCSLHAVEKDARLLSNRSGAIYEYLENWLKKAQRLVTIEIGIGPAIASVRRFAQRQKGKLIRINLSDAELPSGKKKGVSFEMPGLLTLDNRRDAEKFRHSCKCP